jgi:hypothetical protein
MCRLELLQFWVGGGRQAPAPSVNEGILVLKKWCFEHSANEKLLQQQVGCRGSMLLRMSL